MTGEKEGEGRGPLPKTFTMEHVANNINCFPACQLD